MLLPELHRRHSLCSWYSSADCCNPSIKTFGVWLTQAVNSNKDAAVVAFTKNQYGLRIWHILPPLDWSRLPVKAGVSTLRTWGQFRTRQRLPFIRCEIDDFRAMGLSVRCKQASAPGQQPTAGYREQYHEAE